MSKADEGRALLEKANKALNPTALFGLLKSKPDYDLACHYFDSAAVAFKNARIWEECISAYTNAANCYRQMDSLPLAGKAFETAATVANINMRNFDRSIELYLTASEHYAAAGNIDKAVETIEKGVKLYEGLNQLDKACETQLKACDAYEAENKPRMAAETFRRTLSLFVKHRRLQLAINLIPRLANIYTSTSNTPQLFKLNLTAVLVYLAAGDEVGAKRSLDSSICNPAFANSEEAVIAGGFVSAWESGDDEELENLKKKPLITLLDNEIIKLAQSLRLPGGKARKPKRPEDPTTPRPEDVPKYQVGETQGPHATWQADAVYRSPVRPVAAPEEEDDELGIC